MTKGDTRPRWRTGTGVRFIRSDGEDLGGRSGAGVAAGDEDECSVVHCRERELLRFTSNSCDSSSTSSSSSSSSDIASEIAEPRNEVSDEERHEDALDDICQPCKEEPLVRRLRNLPEPTPEKKKKLCAEHLPCRSWCLVNVKARGREDSLLRSQKQSKAIELLQRSMNNAEVGNDQEDGEARKLLVGRDRQRKFTSCHLVMCKGKETRELSKKYCIPFVERATRMSELAIVQFQVQLITGREHKNNTKESTNT